MRKFLTVIFLLNISLNNAYSIQPDVFVQSVVNRASGILSKNISKEEKINSLKIIAKEAVDIRGVGYYSLGSTRKLLDDNQKKNTLTYLKIIFLKVFRAGYQNILIQKLRFKTKKL